MNKIGTYLRSPYPLFYHRREGVWASSVLVFLILLLLQPFGIHQIEHHKLWILLGYMGVTALFQCIPVYLFPVLFPRFYNEDGWTVGRHLANNLFLFLCIGIGNWLYSNLIFGFHWQWELLLIFLLVTTIVGLFPVTLFMLINRNRLLASHLAEAVEMNRHLQDSRSAVVQPESCQETEQILLQGSTKEVLELQACQLVCIEAEGNYIKVIYRKQDKMEQRLLRATMKQAEEAVEACSFVVKCHRAFLVNIHAVTKVSGNSQGYRLSLQGCTTEIPVSRAYAKEIKGRIESMHER
ncbi:MAG: LytTR family DNA-binding domain-containing protein [Bacteroides sp.]|uniref:LytR/AlgR family response regulator transcription factor n=1 Tax=Bacteroides sp. TaxID=29523 RepID=UPI002FC9C054